MENLSKDTIEVNNVESYMIYDSLCDTIISYYNKWLKAKMEDPYTAPYYENKYKELQALADRFSKMNLKNDW